MKTEKHTYENPSVDRVVANVRAGIRSKADLEFCGCPVCQKEIKRKGGKKVTKKKDCVYRAARELNDKDFSQRVADRAEAVGYKGYDTMIKEGQVLFARDLEELE